MQAKWLVFPCSCNETSSTGDLGRERAWFVRKHQEERRKPEILLKCCPTSRKLCVHATVLPCVFGDLRRIQHCFILIWVLECPYPDFSRQGNTWSTHGCAELGRWCLGRRDEQHFFEIRTEMGMEDNTDVKHNQVPLQEYWLLVVKAVVSSGHYIGLLLLCVPDPLWICESGFFTLFNSSYWYTCIESS